MAKHTVLFELGCEELPPKSLKTLRDALKAEVEKERQAHNREKEELKRQANKNKDISSNIAGTLKVVTSVIALIATGILPLIKAKKKET